MDEKQKSCIQRHQNDFLEDLWISVTFLSHLLSAFVITYDEMDRLMVESLTRREKVLRFCQLIVTKGPKAFGAFLEALTHSGQSHIRDKLDADIPSTSDKSGGMTAGQPEGNQEDGFWITRDDIKFLAPYRYQNEGSLVKKAVDEGKQNVLSFLLKCGASVDICDDDNPSLLHRAARAGQCDVLEVLLGAGLSINSADSHGRTPLHASIMAGHSSTSQHLIKDFDADINLVDTSNRNALFLACQFGDLVTSGLLIEKGADYTTKFVETSATALDTACSNGHLEIADLLLKHGANVNVRRDSGATPLLMASQKGHSEVVQLLLASKADVNTRQTGTGITPLWQASQNGHREVVQQLLAAGADVDSPVTDGRTSLWMASQQGQIEVVQLLLAAGADVDVSAHRCNDNTPLHAGSYCGHNSVVSVLLGAGAAVNAVNRDGDTPLHHACRRSFTETARVLLQHPTVDWRIKNKRNQTARSLVKARDHSDILALFSNRK